MTKLDDLEQLANAATRGPYEAVNLSPELGPENEHIAAWAVCELGGARARIAEMFRPPRPANAAFIAACDPQTVLKLVAVARAAGGVIDDTVWDATDSGSAFARLAAALDALGQT